MKKLGYIQETLGAFFLKLKSKANNRTVISNSFRSAKSIGILFDAKDQTEHKKVVSFVDSIVKDFSHNVQTIGFVQNPDLTNAFQGKGGFKFYSKKDFNWYGKATNVYVTEFIDEQFDIFIDLTLESSFAFEYIAQLSQAKFIVGRYIEDKIPYDFMLDIKKDYTLDNLIKQIHIYLSMIQVSK